MNEQERANDVRNRIYDEIVIARDSWSQLLFLYSDPSRLEILKACAPWFFAGVRRLLLREVVLAVSRLTDPLGSGNRENLSIRRLLKDPAVDRHPGFRDELTAPIEAAETAAAPIRPHRHKMIAHLDLKAALAPTDSPLPGLKNSEIANALAALEKACSLHGAKVHGSDMSFELTAMGGADMLIETLESSRRWNEWRDLRDRYGGA